MVLIGCLTLASCGGPDADVEKQLTVQVISTGWRDADRTAGRNKLVPSAAVRIANVSDRTLRSVQVNAVFHRLGDRAAWGSAFATAAGSSGLAPGADATVVLDSERGYTGEDAQQAMLTNREFVDVTVDVFAKYGSHRWTRLRAAPIDRRLLR